MNKAKKGFVFERELAVQLSLWWSGGTRSDVFWRTAGSGGRARIRGKKGESTHNQHGDLMATHPSGEPLMKLAMIELKKGYNRATIQDLVDSPEGAAEQQYAKWFRKCEESEKQSGALSWILIHKRDRREALMFMPHTLHMRLFPRMVHQIDVHCPNIGTVCGAKLSLLSRIDPKVVIEIVQRGYL